VMDDNSGDDDTGEVRWSWRRDESGRGRSRRGWRSEWGSWSSTGSLPVSVNFGYNMAAHWAKLIRPQCWAGVITCHP